MLNENLAKVRKERGLTQEALAAKLNVVRQTISKWEKGTAVPDADTLCRIADALDVSVSTLLGETEQEDKIDT
ncbi:MAG: helix-turn-helix transcriptional regulator, partial [Lachnospiraceae bacterium]|nr:helix-turn-helix transcriptional regulator [Lachnospiraceae bacterium]